MRVRKGSKEGGSWSSPARREIPGVPHHFAALGLDIVVWTVNKPEDIEKMLELKVDGIISDRPDIVRAAMDKRGMRLPRATPIAP